MWIANMCIFNSVTSYLLQGLRRSLPWMCRKKHRVAFQMSAPSSWRRALFTMLAIYRQSAVVTDFRLILMYDSWRQFLPDDIYYDELLLPMIKDVMPRKRRIHVTRWPNNGTQQPAKHNVHLARILFVHLSVGSTETSNRSDYGFKIHETVLHCNIHVYQIWSVCKKRSCTNSVCTPFCGQHRNKQQEWLWLQNTWNGLALQHSCLPDMVCLQKTLLTQNGGDVPGKAIPMDSSTESSGNTKQTYPEVDEAAAFFWLGAPRKLGRPPSHLARNCQHHSSTFWGPSLRMGCMPGLSGCQNIERILTWTSISGIRPETPQPSPFQVAS